MKTPRISVIMGIYNCAPYLQEALDSLYAQTYQDFEIILCEDGSKDNTYEVALENQKQHPNIVLLRNPQNLGLNQTLNNCLAVAQGEYIARMDGDDTCDPTRFEKEVAFLDSHPEYAIVTTPMNHFDENGIFRTSHASGEPAATVYAKHVPFFHAPCMIRTEAYKTVGGYTVSEKLIRQEDYELWIKMYKAGYRGYIIDEPLYNMRDDQNAYKRRNWISRRNEAYVKYLACREMKLPLYCYLYTLKPIILYLLPNWLYNYLHRNR